MEPIKVSRAGRSTIQENTMVWATRNYVSFFLLTVFGFSSLAQAQFSDWLNPVDGDWNEASNWSAGVPGVTAARFNAGGTYEISYAGLATIVDGIEWTDANASLTLASTTVANSQMTVNSDFTVNGALNFLNNESNRTVRLIVAGTVTNASGGTFHFTGSDSGDRLLEIDQFVNHGTVNVDQDAANNRTNSVFDNHNAINIAGGATFDFRLSSKTFNQNGGTVNNQGTLQFINDTLNFNGGNFAGNPVQVSGGTLHIATTGSGAFDIRNITSYSGDLAPGQELNLRTTSGDSVRLEATSDFSNAGTINIVNNHVAAARLASDGSITNSVNGSIHFTGSGSGDRLLEVNHFVNQGTVNVDQDAANNRTNSVFDNHNAINIASGATLDFRLSSKTFNQNGGTVNNQGTLQFINDTLNFNGGNFAGNPVQVSGGNLHIATTGSGTFDIRNVTGYSGDLAPGQELNLLTSPGDNVRLVAGSDFTNSSTINIINDHTTTAELVRVGTITNSVNGSIHFTGSGSGDRLLEVNHFVNQGTVNVDQDAANNRTNSVFDNHNAINIASGATFDFRLSSKTFNQNGGTVDNQGTLQFTNDTLNFNGGNFAGNPVQVSGGTLHIATTGSGTFDIRNFTGYNGDLAPGQELNLLTTSGNNVRLEAASDFTNSSIINIINDHTTTAQLVRDGTVTNQVDGTIHFNGSGSGLRALEISQFVNHGTVTVMNDADFRGGNTSYENWGQINIHSSRLTVANSSTLQNLSTGSIHGVGTLIVGINGMQNDGVIAPGFSAGELNIEGDVAFGATSDLQMELGGTLAGTQHDVVHFTDSVDPGGELTVRFIDGFDNSVSNGDVFTIVTAGALGTGQFINVATDGTVVTTDGMARFSVTYDLANDEVRLSDYESVSLVCDLTGDGSCTTADLRQLYDAIDAAAPGGAADVDRSGLVDNDDISLWLSIAGNVNGRDYLPGDTDLDGAILGNDFTILAASFGQTGLPRAYWDEGNFDGNQGGSFLVGGGDFTVLAANFGFVSASTPSSVPEPGSTMLLLTALVLLASARRFDFTTPG